MQKMEVKALLALPKGFEVTSIERADDVLTIAVVSTQAHPSCPLCASQASRVHSHYMRTVADLPCVGQQVRRLLQVRKFFCDVTSCPRKIFVERIAPFVEPWARVTARLHQTIQVIGLADFRDAWSARYRSLRNTDLPYHDYPPPHGASNSTSRRGSAAWNR